MPDLPDDHALDPAAEVAIRRDLLQVALARRPASHVLRVGRALDVVTGTWTEDAEIVMRGRRIAAVGPAGAWPGAAEARTHRPALSALPGFGDIHRHIESSHLAPEHEAALTLPRGCTWTCEASHELSNVAGPDNLDFWLAPRRAGCPAKIFVLPGSAVPPTAYERTGGHYDAAAQRAFLRDPMVPGLDEVMDWPAVSDPLNPGHDRLWGMIGATLARRGTVEGHAAGIRDAPRIDAFAAAGLSSDHEATAADEAWDKLARGLFVQIRAHSTAEIVGGLLKRGLDDWSQIALVTDDRPAWETLRLGGADHNLREAIRAGLSPERAVRLVTLNPARHMRLLPWVGLLAPGRYADVVLMADVAEARIAEVWADGAPVSEGARYTGPLPRIVRPAAITASMRVGRALTADDFAVPAPEGRATVQAAVLRPFHWADDFLTETLAVQDGRARRDPARAITVFSVIDRHHGTGAVGRMFWRGCGPATPGTALACSVAHDSHDLWCVGSDDAAMAEAANAVAEQDGGWALVTGGRIAARIRFELGGLMTARPAAAVAADWRAMLDAAEAVAWHYEPTFSPRWHPGFPHRLQFATLTCAPWRWVLVAPNPAAPTGLVNVATGRSHPVVW